MAVLKVAEFVKAQSALVTCSDPIECARLEALVGMSQDEAVTDIIETTCCAEDLPQYQGGRGTARERREALLALWQRYREQKA